MYKSFKVSNFRCFSELTLNHLERVNLIAGANNVGKTALLEALFLHCGSYNPELAMRLNAFRGIESIKVEFGPQIETPWDSLFNKFDITKKVELVGQNTVTGIRRVTIRVVSNPSDLDGVIRSIAYRNSGTEGTLQRFEATPTLASEPTLTLVFEYEEDKRTGQCILMLDPRGWMRIEPPPPPPPFPAYFLASRVRIPPKEDAERFSRLEIIGQQDVVLEALKLIENRLDRIAVAVVGGVPLICGEIRLGRLIPLPVMGEGMARLASLVVAIGNAPKGVVLIDEIENGLHHSVLTRVWKAIGDAARRFDTQVFATTHSLECVIAAHRAFLESGDYSFRLHRLEYEKETITVKTYDQETLDAAIEAGLEVR